MRILIIILIIIGGIIFGIFHKPPSVEDYCEGKDYRICQHLSIDTPS